MILPTDMLMIRLMKVLTMLMMVLTMLMMVLTMLMMVMTMLMMVMTMLMMVMMMTKMWICGCVRRREHRLVPRIVRKGIKGGNSAVR